MIFADLEEQIFSSLPQKFHLGSNTTQNSHYSLGNTWYVCMELNHSCVQIYFLPMSRSCTKTQVISVFFYVAGLFVGVCVRRLDRSWRELLSWNRGQDRSRFNP